MKFVVSVEMGLIDLFLNKSKASALFGKLREDHPEVTVTREEGADLKPDHVIKVSDDLDTLEAVLRLKVKRGPVEVIVLAPSGSPLAQIAETL